MSSQHIIDNFGLYGFGTRADGFFQSVKEMFENSIDSIGSLSQKTGKVGLVKVGLTSNMSDPDIAAVEVTDSGAGMVDPMTCLDCFASTKSVSYLVAKGENSAAMTAGKFGVGLTAVALYSAVNTQSEMRIITIPVGESTVAVVVDLHLDQTTLKLTASQQKRVAMAGSSTGTIVRVKLPATEYDIKKFADTFDLYLFRLFFLPTTTITVQVNFNTAHLSKSFVQNGASIHESNLSDSSPDHFKMIFVDRVRNILGAEESCEYAEVAFNSQDDGTTVVVAVVIISDMRIPNADTSRPHTIKGDLWRYANSVPLIDQGDEVLGCLTFTTLRAFPWKKIGHKFNCKQFLARSSTSAQPQSQSLQHSLAQSSSFSLEATNEWLLNAPHGITKIPHKLIVLVDVRCPQVPYQNMRKSCIAPNDGIEDALSRGLLVVMKSLAEQSSALGLFSSVHDRKKREVSSKHIPSVANSVAKLVLCCSAYAPEYSEACREALGFDPFEGNEEDLAVNLHHKMQAVYDDTIDKQQKTARAKRRKGPRGAPVDEADEEEEEGRGEKEWRGEKEEGDREEVGGDEDEEDESGHDECRDDESLRGNQTDRFSRDRGGGGGGDWWDAPDGFAEELEND